MQRHKYNIRILNQNKKKIENYFIGTIFIIRVLPSRWRARQIPVKYGNSLQKNRNKK